MRAALRLIVVVVLGLVSMGALGCSREEPVVDTVLLAFLSQARAAHHDADLAERTGEPRNAIGPLLGVAGSPLLRQPSPPPEAREVGADTLARIADLQSSFGDFDAAEGAVGRGLSLATEATYFRGHLFEVQGLVLERRAASQEAAGDAAGAASSRREAIAAFEAAIAIQADVIERAMNAADPR